MEISSEALEYRAELSKKLNDFLVARDMEELSKARAQKRPRKEIIARMEAILDAGVVPFSKEEREFLALTEELIRRLMAGEKA